MKFRGEHLSGTVMNTGSKGCPAFIIRQGSSTVRAYRCAGDRYCLAYYRFKGDKLQRKTKTGETAARALAHDIALALANGRAQVLELTHADRENYLYAKNLLAGTPLAVAIEEWHQAKQLLPPGVSLIKAVRDWRERNFIDNTHLFRYEAVPPPRVAASKSGALLPRTSGIYFVWSNKRCVYVGRSANLHERCRIGKHSAILSEEEQLSWIEEAPARLEIAEAYYIGSLRPERNYLRSVDQEQANELITGLPPG